MRGALIHAVLLAVMLVYGYRTWTRDKTVEPTQGNVVLWDKSESDLVSIEYKAPKKIVKIERKPEGYWWGTDITIETKPKAKPPGAGSGSDAGSAAGSGSAGSGSAGSGSAATPPPPPEEEEVGRKSHEFPLGDSGDKLIKDFANAHALRDLGVPTDDNKKDYKIVDSKTTLTLTFKDGPKTFTVGGPVYGGTDKYVVDKANGKAYVFSKDLMSGLEIGESSLHLVDPKGFEASKVEEVTIEAGGKSKTVARIETESEGQKKKTWADADTKKPNQMAANFVDNANNLRPTEYAANIKLSDLTPVLKLTYKGDKGGLLGTLTLYRMEKPGQLAPDQELDPANPPKGDTEYYVMTERTRVPGLVPKASAQRTESDIDDVFSGKQPEAAGSGSPHSIDPKGNPFGGGHGAPPGGGLKPGAGGMTPPPVPSLTPNNPGARPGSVPTAPNGASIAPKPAPGNGAAIAPPATGGATAPNPGPGKAPSAPKPATAAPPATPKPPTTAAGGATK